MVQQRTEALTMPILFLLGTDDPFVPDTRSPPGMDRDGLVDVG